jgi:hypothetical protein
MLDARLGAAQHTGRQQGRRLASAEDDDQYEEENELNSEEENSEAEDRERERQRNVVKNSRQSLSNFTSAATAAKFSGIPFTPLRPPAVKQTKSHIKRRLSDGQPNTESSPVPRTAPSPASPTMASFDVLSLDNNAYQRYDATSRHLKDTVTKFHGSTGKDGERTVHEFVRLINAEMDGWMGAAAQMGRLNLVLARTDGQAQNWLVKKREELTKLRALGDITDPLVTEWVEVQHLFIAEMSKGATKAVYELQMHELSLKDKSGKFDPQGFLTRFEQIADRMEPPTTWVDETDRRRALARLFEDRVKNGGGHFLWETMVLLMAGKNIPVEKRTVDDWQQAFIEAWTVKQDARNNGSRPPWKKYNDYQGHQKDEKSTSQPSHGSTQRVNAVTSDPVSDEETEEGRQEGVQAATTGPTRAPRNTHITKEQKDQLQANGVCLSCYKTNHWSRECRAPANRPPTAAELKVKADRKK